MRDDATPPAQLRLPDGPAVRFDPGAARTWLLAPLGDGTTRAGRLDIGPAETFHLPAQPDLDVQVIGEWVQGLLPQLARAAAPTVWQSPPGVTVDFTSETTIVGGDGGSYLFVETCGVRLASEMLLNADFAQLGSNSPGAAAKTKLDVAVEALATCANMANTLVEAFRRAVAALAADPLPTAGASRTA